MKHGKINYFVQRKKKTSIRTSFHPFPTLPSTNNIIFLLSCELFSSLRYIAWIYIDFIYIFVFYDGNLATHLTNLSLLRFLWRNRRGPPRYPFSSSWGTFSSIFFSSIMLISFLSLDFNFLHYYFHSLSLSSFPLPSPSSLGRIWHWIFVCVFFERENARPPPPCWWCATWGWTLCMCAYIFVCCLLCPCMYKFPSRWSSGGCAKPSNYFTKFWGGRWKETSERQSSSS